MKILLPPAEAKNPGGKKRAFCKKNFFLKELFEKREQIVDLYEDYILNLDLEELSKWFGFKNMKDVKKYQQEIKTKPTLKAIERYNGIFFNALYYEGLNKEAQQYIDNNTILFSNLFGPMRADDLIPDYKYKQSAKLPNIDISNFYLENFTPLMDEYLGEEVIDLRAKCYDKYYKVTKAKTVILKFIKDGRVVSHWSKHYKGIIFKYIALNNISSIKEFIELFTGNLKPNNSEGFINPISSNLKVINIEKKDNVTLLRMKVE